MPKQTPQQVSPKKVLRLIQSFHYEEALANAQLLMDRKFKKEYSMIAKAGLGQKFSRSNQLAIIASAVFYAQNGEAQRARAILKKLAQNIKPELRADFHLAAMLIMNKLNEFQLALGEYQLVLFYKPARVQRERAEQLAQQAQEEIAKLMVGTGSLHDGDSSQVFEESFQNEEEDVVMQVHDIPEVINANV